jgi:hypothetical protein
VGTFKRGRTTFEDDEENEGEETNKCTLLFGVSGTFEFLFSRSVKIMMIN